MVPDYHSSMPRDSIVETIKLATSPFGDTYVIVSKMHVIVIVHTISSVFFGTT